MRALWRFIAGDSRIAPIGIALALLAAALGRHFEWSAPSLEIVYVGLLAITLGASAFERP